MRELFEETTIILVSGQLNLFVFDYSHGDGNSTVGTYTKG